MRRLIFTTVFALIILSLSASTAWTSPCCYGDYNCDNKVNFQDYVAFIGDFVRGLLKIAPSEICGNANIPMTGQTTSYATGDDGDLQMGVAWPNPRFTDNEDGTVTDNLTGLIWLQDANCFGLRTWEDALSDCKGLANGSCGLTDSSHVGDWRLPNDRELFSLVDAKNYEPALPSGHPFFDVQPDIYWSSTASAAFPGSVWVVSLPYGITYSVDITGPGYSWVWPVRGGH